MRVVLAPLIFQLSLHFDFDGFEIAAKGAIVTNRTFRLVGDDADSLLVQTLVFGLLCRATTGESKVRIVASRVGFRAVEYGVRIVSSLASFSITIRLG